MAKLTKAQYEANQAAKFEKKRIEREQFKVKRAADEQAKLEKETRKPIEIQEEIAACYFRLGQTSYGIKQMEMAQHKENLALNQLLSELEKSQDVWGYPEDEVISQGANDVVPQTQQ